MILPIYYQIKQTIKNWIIDGEFNPGERLPSENALAEKFNVSRLTVRQATVQLVQEGLLISKRGEGTFVTDDHHLIDSFGLEFSGFMDPLLYQVSKSKTKSVEIVRIPVTKVLKEKLELENTEEEVIQLRRVRLLDKNVFCYTVNFLPLEIGTKLVKKDLYEKPLLQILELDLGIHFTEAFQTIQASFADTNVAEQLGIATGSPILFVERIMYTRHRKPVELVQTSYRGDQYKYIVRLKNVRKRNENIWVHQRA